MRFKPFVFGKENQHIPVSIVPMVQGDALSTNLPPVWQTSWTSEYLTKERFEKYAAKVGDELIALCAYEILKHLLVMWCWRQKPPSWRGITKGILGRFRFLRSVPLPHDT